MVKKAPPGAWEKGKPPEQVERYVEWLVTPQDLRSPKTKAEWARAEGVDRRTLTTWEHDDRVRWLINEAAHQLNMSPERVQMVMNAMFAKAQQGDTQAAKLYMEHVARIQSAEPKAGGFEDMTDDELAALAAEVAKR